MKTRPIVQSLAIAASVLVGAGVAALAFCGMAPVWLGLVALVPLLGCFLWISDDIRARRTDPYRPTHPQSMIEQEGRAPSREEYMRPKPFVRDS
jgi:hypothetical protein